MGKTISPFSPPAIRRATVGTTASNTIKTGTATSGNTSSWFFKLSSPSSGLAIESGFDANHAIPNTRTKIASRSTGASAAAGDTVNVTYSAYVSPVQAPDTYTGKVAYTLFYTNTATSSGKTMQTFACSSLQEGQITTLIDSRDGNPYNVAKLKDGKCWMVDNLRLGKKGATMTLTSADSDVSANFTLAANDANAFDNTADKNAVYIKAEYGGYYSWYTATAGTGKSTTTTGNATSSICPKGWRLPTSGSGGEFEVMAKKYGNGTDQAISTALRATPIPGFTLSGIAWGKAVHDVGTSGVWWSSMVTSGTAAYGFRVKADTVFSADSNNKYDGRAVRCIARN